MEETLVDNDFGIEVALPVAEVDIDKMLEEFYKQPMFFSYSSMKKLIWHPPSFFTQYVLKQREEKLDKHLIEGKVIHCLVLDEKMYHQQFMVSPMNVPTGNNKKVVDRIYALHREQEKACGCVLSSELKEYRQEIIDYLLELNLHQSLKDDKPTKTNPDVKTGDDKRLEKILTEENINYFEFRKKAEGRDVIDEQTERFCKAAADLIRNDSFLCTLMGIGVTEFDNVEVINEQEFRCNLADYPFGLKGIIDNLVIDHDAKVIRINDLKTSGRSLNDFKDSVDYFDYWLQAVFYTVLVTENFRELVQDKGYTIVFRFIVIDRSQQIYAFEVTEATMDGWFKKSEEWLDKANYHYTERKYNLPYEFCKGLVAL